MGDGTAEVNDDDDEMQNDDQKADDSSMARSVHRAPIIPSSADIARLRGVLNERIRRFQFFLSKEQQCSKKLEDAVRGSEDAAKDGIQIKGRLNIVLREYDVMRKEIKDLTAAQKKASERQESYDSMVAKLTASLESLRFKRREAKKAVKVKEDEVMTQERALVFSRGLGSAARGSGGYKEPEETQDIAEHTVYLGVFRVLNDPSESAWAEREKGNAWLIKVIMISSRRMCSDVFYRLNETDITNEEFCLGDAHRHVVQTFDTGRPVIKCRACGGPGKIYFDWDVPITAEFHVIIDEKQRVKKGAKAFKAVLRRLNKGRFIVTGRCCKKCPAQLERDRESARWAALYGGSESNQK